jgi:hypothetical protein
MYPSKGKLIDASSLTLYDGATGGKGQQIDPRRCGPMSEVGPKAVLAALKSDFRYSPSNGHH